MAARVDPYKNFNFRVEIDGITVAGFSECSGLESEVAVIEYREGADISVRKLPGLAKFGDVSLCAGCAWNSDRFKDLLPPDNAEGQSHAG